MDISEIKAVYPLLNEKDQPVSYIIEYNNGETISYPYDSDLEEYLFNNQLMFRENVILPGTPRYVELSAKAIPCDDIFDYSVQDDDTQYGSSGVQDDDTQYESSGVIGDDTPDGSFAVIGDGVIPKVSPAKKAAGIVVATAAGLGVVSGAAAMVKKVSNDKTGENNISQITNTTPNQTISSLESFAIDAPFRVFYETAFDVLTILNNNALNKEIFMLEEDIADKAVLQFTFDEIVSAMLMMNDYSQEELYQIFGLEELNTQELMNNYQSFASKMSVYMMNAKRASGISKLITNEANRQWFETIEKTIIDFNNNITNENADILIRTFAYFYNHNVNGVDNINNDEATINCIKNLMLNMVRGYYNANSQEDYLTYLTVSSAPTDFDDKYVANEASQVQKGETLKFYLDNVESGNCTLSVVEEHFNTLISRLNDSQELQKNVSQQLLIKLTSVLVENNEVELAEKIIDGISPEESKLLEASSCSSEYEIYKKQQEQLNGSQKLIIIQTLRQQLDQEIEKRLVEVFKSEKLSDIKINDITLLYNNRVRGREKIITSSTDTSYGDSYTAGTTTTTTTTEQVSKDELTPDELEEAKRQEAEIESVIIGDDTYYGTASDAAKEAFYDASTWATSPGTYSSGEIINSINPEYPSVVPTNGSLADVASAKYAFENVKITTGDSQIQAELAAAIDLFGSKTSDQELIEAYSSAWLSTIEQILNSAYAEGLITRNEAIELYEEANRQVSNKNEQENQDVPTTQNPSDSDNSGSLEDTPILPDEETTVITPPSEPDKDNESDFTEIPADSPGLPTEGGYVASTDPNINPVIPDSEEGFEDYYDSSIDSEDTKYGYIADDSEPYSDYIDYSTYSVIPTDAISEDAISEDDISEDAYLKWLTETSDGSTMVEETTPVSKRLNIK